MIRYYSYRFTSEDIKRKYDYIRKLGYDLRIIYEKDVEHNDSFYTVKLGTYSIDIISSGRNNKFELLLRGLDILYTTLRLIESQKNLPRGFLKRNPELKIRIK